MKTVTIAGTEYPVENGVVRLTTEAAEALLCTHKGYEKGMRSTVAKAVNTVQETLYKEVCPQMLKGKLSTDLAIVVGSAGAMVPTVVITREKAGVRVDKDGTKHPYAKHAGVSTKFRSCKPTASFNKEVIEEMAAKFAAAMKKK